MSNSKVPTIIAIFILASAMVAILFIINQAQQFKSNAQNSFAIQDLRIGNVTDKTFSVSWLTDTPAIGFVEYTDTNGQIKKSQITPSGLTHFVNISGLNPASSYTFTVDSNGNTFDNNGIAWKVQTSTTQTTAGTVISGKVLDTNNLPAKGALVYVNVPPGQTFSTQVSATGNWVIALPTVSDTTILDILIESSSTLMSTAKIDLKSANPTPTMTLGKDYNFVNQETQSTQDLPNVQIQLPN